MGAHETFRIAWEHASKMALLLEEQWAVWRDPEGSFHNFSRYQPWDSINRSKGRALVARTADHRYDRMLPPGFPRP